MWRSTSTSQTTWCRSYISECLASLDFELEICSIRCVHCNQAEDVCTSAASPFIAHQGMPLVQHSSAKNGCMLKAHGQTAAADALPHIVGVTIVLWRTQLENTATVVADIVPIKGLQYRDMVLVSEPGNVLEHASAAASEVA